MSKPRIAFIQSDESMINSSRWLCHWPAQDLKRRGYPVVVMPHLGYAAMEGTPIEQADIVIVELPMMADVHPTSIKSWIKKGKVVFAIFDDAYHHMPEPIKAWAKINIERRGDKIVRMSAGQKALEEAVALCDGVIVPSRLLMQFWTARSKACFWVRNRLPRDVMVRGYSVPPRPIVGWGGSTQHMHTICNTGALEALASLRGIDVEIVGLAPVADMINKLGGKAKLIPWQATYEEWMETISRWTIGIAPLWGEYDAHRSWIKVLEYAALGIPWVATQSVPYEECEGGIFVPRHNHKWWRKAIGSLFGEGNPYAEKYGAEGNSWANKQWIELHNEWVDVIEYGKEVLGGR